MVEGEGCSVQGLPAGSPGPLQHPRKSQLALLEDHSSHSFQPRAPTVVRELPPSERGVSDAARRSIAPPATWCRHESSGFAV